MWCYLSGKVPLCSQLTLWTCWPLPWGSEGNVVAVSGADKCCIRASQVLTWTFPAQKRQTCWGAQLSAVYWRRQYLILQSHTAHVSRKGYHDRVLHLVLSFLSVRGIHHTPCPVAFPLINHLSCCNVWKRCLVSSYSRLGLQGDLSLLVYGTLHLL